MACAAHGRACPCQTTPSNPNDHEVEIAGPPCVFWSKRGKQEGKNAVEFVVHEVWMQFVRARGIPIILFENVP
eukprot:15442425-Alexandrium_andersonii.AAC.1